ncbi:hypothetical protein CB452P1_000021 [Clostridium phage CB452P1]|nr:hypothetical protein CB452P1_000021 [Clostridium phage CB452P1]
MAMFLYRDPNTDFIRLPVIPNNVQVQSSQKNETFESLGIGELKLIGLKGARVVSFSSFFPVKNYVFRDDRRHNGMEYIKKIEAWRDDRKPIYVLFDDMWIYWQCCVDDITYNIQDGSGDIYYTITLSEFIRPQIEKTTTSNETLTTVSSDVSIVPVGLMGSVTGDNVNVRTGPGLGYSVIAQAFKGNRYALYRQEGEWWQINHRGQVAYISSKYIAEE